MKTEELFEVQETPSPKLAWKRKYGVRTKETGDEQGAEDLETGDTLHAWVAWVYEGKVYPPRYAPGGPTEDDALAALARRNGWLLWNEEGAVA